MMFNFGKACLICLITGRILPWALIILGSGFALLDANDTLNKASAYLTGFGLLIMAMAFFLARFLNNLANQPR